MVIRLKRVYDPPAADDGMRILVDRLWPRGLSKAKAGIDIWLKAVAPSDVLRHWYQHAPEKWPEFRKRYAAELMANAEAVQELRAHCARGDVCFLYASKETEINNAVALRDYVEGRL